ncbi:MAG: hypothetical protein IPO81_18070 [Kouleothrix sp.]|nr:hypothetical protein [Kouleothrix sp.]
MVAAYLVKLHEGKRSIGSASTACPIRLRRTASTSPPASPNAATAAPSCATDLPNPALQFLLDASVQLLRATLPLDQQATFGDTIAGDTQAILAWVRENNPKEPSMHCAHSASMKISYHYRTQRLAPRSIYS